MPKTRAEERGVKLPFSTVEGGLEFGRLKVEEHLREVQEKQQEEAERMQAAGGGNGLPSYPGMGDQNLEELEALNFNAFLEEYEAEIERNLEMLEQASETPQNKNDKGDEQDKEREDDFDLDNSDPDDLDDVGDDEPSSDSKKKKHVKKHTVSKSKSKADKQAKKKSINATRTQQRGIRERASSIDKKNDLKKGISSSKQQQQQEKLEQQRTKKVIVARYTEVVAKDNKGRDILKQTEKVKDQAIGDKSKTPEKPNNGKALSIKDKIAEAKLTVYVDKMLDSAARMTHQTGRATEFKVGNETLQFKREGQDTFAVRNGEKIPIDEAKGMLKDMGRSIGLGRMEQLSQIIKVAQQNPGIRTLSQNKEQTSETQKEHKVITTHAR